MEKLVNNFFLLLSAIWALTFFYILFFTKGDAQFNIIGPFEANKLMALGWYALLSALTFFSSWKKSKVK
jgi:hypothetical protein